MIGQQIGLPALVPISLQKLKADPLVEGDCYPGDLLAALIKIPDLWWQRNLELRGQVVRIAESIDREEIDRRTEKRLAQQLREDIDNFLTA